MLVACAGEVVVCAGDEGVEECAEETFCKNFWLMLAELNRLTCAGAVCVPPGVEGALERVEAGPLFPFCKLDNLSCSYCGFSPSLLALTSSFALGAVVDGGGGSSRFETCSISLI